MITENYDKRFIENNEKQIVFIEKEGNIRNVPCFNNKLTFIQNKIINICKYDEKACIDYAYLYLKILEKDGIIKILNYNKKIISPESVSRITRKLKEYSNYNKELAFLIKYQDKDYLDEISKEYYRSN